MADRELRPRRRPKARVQAWFLRLIAQSGSQAEAAARAGVTPRTVRRWCADDARFADRYEMVMARRARLLAAAEFAVDRRSVFHRRRRLPSVERCNDMQLMRLLSRLDQLRARVAAASQLPSQESSSRRQGEQRTAAK